VGRLRAADWPRPRTPRHPLLRDPRRSLARLPPARPARRDGADGPHITHTHEANPGEVWEEGEFWIELAWRADPDGTLGIRQCYESPYRPGEKITLEEYYRWMFENSVPGLPEKAAAQGMTPLEDMRRHGWVEIAHDEYHQHEAPVHADEPTEVRGPERGHPPRRTRRLPPHGTLAAHGGPGHGAMVLPCTPMPSRACTAGIRRSASDRHSPATATPTSTVDFARAPTCTANGWRSPDRRAASCAARSGLFRPLKPVFDTYRLPDHERTDPARTDAPASNDPIASNGFRDSSPERHRPGSADPQTRPAGPVSVTSDAVRRRPGERAQ
jgi:hypothetical protein